VCRPTQAHSSFHRRVYLYRRFYLYHRVYLCRRGYFPRPEILGTRISASSVNIHKPTSTNSSLSHACSLRRGQSQTYRFDHALQLRRPRLALLQLFLDRLNSVVAFHISRLPNPRELADTVRVEDAYHFVVRLKFVYLDEAFGWDWNGRIICKGDHFERERVQGEEDEDDKGGEEVHYDIRIVVLDLRWKNFDVEVGQADGSERRYCTVALGPCG
jgi:hypothetical protein